MLYGIVVDVVWGGSGCCMEKWWMLCGQVVDVVWGDGGCCMGKW